MILTQKIIFLPLSVVNHRNDSCQLQKSAYFTKRFLRIMMLYEKDARKVLQSGVTSMNQQERRIYLIRKMQREMPQYADIPIPEEEMRQRRLLRSLFNLRPPYPASEDFLSVQDAYLSEVIRERGSSGSAVRESQSQNLPLAGRHHNASLRRDRKRGKQRAPWMLAALPFLHRQHHSLPVRCPASHPVQ